MNSKLSKLTNKKGVRKRQREFYNFIESSREPLWDINGISCERFGISEIRGTQLKGSRQGRCGQ